MGQVLYSQLRHQLSVLNARLRRYRQQAKQMDTAYKRLRAKYQRAASLSVSQHKALVASWEALDAEHAWHLITSDPQRFAVLSEIPDIIRLYHQGVERKHHGCQEEGHEEEGHEKEGHEGAEACQG